MWRNAGITVISVLFLTLMSTGVHAQHEEHHQEQETGETVPATTDQGMACKGMGGMMEGGMTGMCPMCGNMMGKGMGGMMGQGMMGKGIGGMMGDPIAGVLHQFGGPGFYNKWAGQLGLSEDQQDQLEGIWTSHRKSMIRKRADLEIAEVELKEALGKAEPDYDDAKSKIKRIGDLREEIALAGLSAMQKARKVLTAEQLRKVKSLRRMPMGGGQGMMMPMGKQQGMMDMPVKERKHK